MKSEIAASIAVAALAAAASIFGVLHNQYGSLKLERQKWRQTVEAETLRLEREAVSDLAKALATAFYLSEDMIWRVEMMAVTLTQKDFVGYAKASEALKPKLVTAEIMLAAISAVRYAKVQAALAEYRRVDEQLIVTGRNIDADRKNALHLLGSEVKKLPEFRALVLRSLSDAASVQTGLQQ